MARKLEPCGLWQEEHIALSKGAWRLFFGGDAFILAWQARQSSPSFEVRRPLFFEAWGAWQERQPLASLTGACAIATRSPFSPWHSRQSLFPAPVRRAGFSEEWG